MASTIFPKSVGSGRIDTTNPASKVARQDTNIVKETISYATGSVQDAHFCCYVPSNIVSASPNVTVRIGWRSPATTGNVAWQMVYAYYADGVVLSAPSSGSTISSTTAVPGTANAIAESTFALNTVPADRFLSFVIRRNTTGDTAANYAEIEYMTVEVSTDSSVSNLYVWVPTQAMAIPAASGATRASVGCGASANILPENIIFRDAVSDYVTFDLPIPATYAGTISTKLVIATNSSGSGNAAWRFDAATVATGGATDPALTTGTVSAIPVSNGAVKIQNGPAIPVSLNPSDLLNLKLTRIGSDATNDPLGTSCGLVGVLFILAVNTRNPGMIVVSPASGAESTLGAMTMTQVNDTNTSKFVAQAPQSVDTKAAYVLKVPSTYGSGGTLRVRWRSTASSGNAVFRVDSASPAVGSASDPALGSSSNVVSSCGGASVRNEFTVDVSSGLASSDALNFYIYRLGTNGSDTLAGTVEIIDVVFETLIQAP